MTTRDSATMDLSFNKTFSPVVKLFTAGGVYFPGSEVLYSRSPRTVKILTYATCMGLWAVFAMEAVNQFIFMGTNNKAEGMTDIFMALSFGVALPTYIFLLYAPFNVSKTKRIVDIWEKEMTNPPFWEDRKTAIAEIQRYLSRLVKAQIYGFVIPLTVWSARTIVSKEPILPIVYKGDVTLSPAPEIISLFFGYFGYSLAIVWSVSANIEILFMKCILGELNHLHLAVGKILTFKVNEKAERGGQSFQEEQVVEMEEKLRTWIIYHQTVLRFSDEVNYLIGPLILVQDMCAMVFTFSGLFVIVSGRVPIYNTLSAAGYCLFYAYSMWLANNLGDEIRTKSMNIVEMFHGREYFLYTKNIIQNVRFIQFVATYRPINIAAVGYRNLSRRSLAEIISKGYEIMTFMNKIVNRNET